MNYQIVSERKAKNPVRIISSQDTYAVVKRYAGAKKEQFIVITLNGRHAVISVEIVSIGIVNRTITHPREVFAKAIQDRAVSIILCHNHPSGETLHSFEDIHLTRQLIEAGKILGIPVIDHLVISKSGYLSMEKEGYLNPREKKKKKEKGKDSPQ
jgi:DNA repair protein RadC